MSASAAPHRPNTPKNHPAICLLLILGVKLITLSASPSPSLVRSGVCGAGTVLPRGRVGVVLGLHVALLRKLSDFAVRLTSEGVGVVSFVMCDVVAFVAVVSVPEL